MPKQTQIVTCGWLLAVFMLCVLQGWLLTVTSALAGIVFWFGSLFIARAIALSKPQVIAVFILIAWSSAIAWTIAGTLFDAWQGAIGWTTAIAVSTAMFVSVTLSWAWIIVVVMVGQELLKSLSRIQTFVILMLNSWLGLGVGLAWALISCQIYRRVCLN